MSEDLFSHCYHLLLHDHRGAATASAFVPNNIGWPSSFDNSYLYGDVSSRFLVCIVASILPSRSDCCCMVP